MKGKKKRDMRDVRAWDRWRDSARRKEALAKVPGGIEVLAFVDGFEAGIRAGKREARKDVR